MQKIISSTFIFKIVYLFQFKINQPINQFPIISCAYTHSLIEYVGPEIQFIAPWQA